jgi:hypothetical protein
MEYNEYKKAKDEKLKELAELKEELSNIANVFFSSEDGRKFANQMLTAVHYFDCLPSTVSDEDLRYIQAQRDFVNIFLIGLIEKKTFIQILENRK